MKVFIPSRNDAMKYEIIIVGAGPAGLSAGIYSSRSGFKTLLIDGKEIPSQIALTHFLDNYPGFVDGANGTEFIYKLKEQAKKFGIDIIEMECKELKKSNNLWEVTLDNNNVYISPCVIIATGARYRKLGIPGECEFIGRGVSYCAVCDAVFFKGKRIGVIGGGDTALQETLYLSNFADEIYLIHRRDRFRGVPALQRKIQTNERVRILYNTIAKEIIGDEKVRSLKVIDVLTQEERILNVDGIFIFAGHTPNTEFLKGIVELDKDGYIITDDTMSTSEPGLFACGDCRKRPLRQVITACAEGAIAGYSASKYLENLKQ